MTASKWIEGLTWQQNSEHNDAWKIWITEDHSMYILWYWAQGWCQILNDESTHSNALKIQMKFLFNV